MEKVSCDVCGRKFKTNEALNQHKNDAHKQKTTETVIRKKKITKGKVLSILIPILIVAGVGYGIYWSLGNSANIGLVGSTHIHTDFAIYLYGEEITPLPKKYFVKSPYVHIEDGPGEGSVIHIHATGVPLKMFFDSLGMRLTSQCFEFEGIDYCNDLENTLKMYIKHNNGDWAQNFEYGDYVFEDLDKILITYGNESIEEIQQQQNNVTDFSRDNPETALRR